MMSGGKDDGNMEFEKPDLSSVNQYIYDKVTGWLETYVPKLEALSKDQQAGLIKNIQEEMKLENGPDFSKLPIAMNEL